MELGTKVSPLITKFTLLRINLRNVTHSQKDINKKLLNAA